MVMIGGGGLNPLPSKPDIEFYVYDAAQRADIAMTMLVEWERKLEQAYGMYQGDPDNQDYSNEATRLVTFVANLHAWFDQVVGDMLDAGLTTSWLTDAMTTAVTGRLEASGRAITPPIFEPPAE